jgi:hypothetical protein
MKRILVAVVLVFAAIYAFKIYDKGRTVDVARGRVAAVLRAMGEKDEQAALCFWALNKEVLDRETMAFYYDRYLKFVFASGLDGSGWSVGDAKPTDDARATIVTVRNGERTVTLKVTEGLPIELRE